MTNHVLKKPGKLLYILVGITLVIITGVYLVLFNLPPYVEKKLTEFLKEQTHFQHVSLAVSRIGLSESETGTVVIGDSSDPLLKINTIHLEYDLKGLYKRKVKSILINGMNIHMRVQNGQVLMPDSDRNIAMLLSGNSISGNNNRNQPPFDRLSIKNGLFHIRNGDQSVRIPFDCVILSDQNNYGNMNSIINLYPLQSEISIAAGINLAKEKIRFELAGEKIDFTHLDAYLKFPENAHLSGLASINSEMNISYSPFQIIQSETTCTVSRFGLLSDSFRVKTSDQAFNVYLNKKPDGSWHMNSTPFDLVKPLSSTLSGLNLSLQTEEDTTIIKGNTVLTVNPQMIRKSGAKTDTIAKAFNANLHLYSRINSNKEWTAELTSRIRNPEKAETLSIILDQMEVSAANPHISISADGNMEKGSIHTNLRLPKGSATYPGSEIHYKDLVFSSESTFAMKNSQLFHESEFNVVSKNNFLQGDGFQIKSPRIEFSGKAETLDSRLIESDFKTSLINGTMVNPKLGLSVKGINIKQPWSLNPVKKKNPGYFSVKEIILKKIEIGSVQGKILQDQQAFIATGTYKSGFLDLLSADYTGKLDLKKEIPALMLNYKVPEFTLKKDINLKDLISGAPDILVGGTFYAQGNYRFDPYISNGSLTAGYKNGTVRMEDNALILKNISTEVTFPNIPEISTLPDQIIHVTMAEIGDIRLSNGIIHCRLESESSLFLEKSSFDWCDGNIDLQSLRISPEKNEYDITLFCNQLNLDKLLKQLGDIKSEGGGTLNGKIPILIHEGKISFNNGFLYSTPGRGGNIKLISSDILTSGAPVGTPQFAQIDLASEALKDYDYNWTKLGISSDEDTLHVKLQFDGKPSRPLPFTYDQGKGGFLRSKTSEMDFKGLSLDINLNFPLNKILKYDKLTELMLRDH